MSPEWNKLATISGITSREVDVSQYHGSITKATPENPQTSQHCTVSKGLTHFFPTFQHVLSERLTSLGIMGEPRVPPLNPPESIVLSEHYRL